jgi:hypothetical protein
MRHPRAKSFLLLIGLAIPVVVALSGCDALLGKKSSGGSGDIAGSGDLFTEDPYDKALSDPVTETVEPEDISSPTYVCTTTQWGTSEIRDLTERAALGQDESIYPGALLQGQSFQDGSFTPITISRSGGTIYMTGLTLDSEAQISRKLNKISGSAVNQAISDIILDSDVQGTAAEASFSVVQTYSSDHMFFSLGVDARYGAGSMSADLSMDTTSQKNYILMKFTQKYFDIVFEDPEKATSVFKDGSSFDDSENQIGKDNPPLYVSRVSYGRQVFFVAESEYNASTVKAALEGAYDGVGASVEVDANLTNEQVMSKTTMYYYVRGGDAGLALAPIGDSNGTTDMFNAIKAFLADPAAANFSASSPGVPISYTLKYLKSRQVAQMSYNVVYDRKDCTDVSGNKASFSVEISDIDDSATIELNSTSLGEFTDKHTADLSGNSNWLDAASNSVKVRLYNGYCYYTSLTTKLYRNGSEVWKDVFGGSFGWACGQTHRVELAIDPTNGEYVPNVIQY